MNPEGTDLLQTRLRETETKLKMNLCQTVITTIAMKTTTVEAKAAADEENENDCIDSGDRDESSDVILAFIDDEEEVERPATTRSGRGIQKIRSWFLSFQYFFQRIESELANFFFADFVVHSSLLYTTKSAKKNSYYSCIYHFQKVTDATVVWIVIHWQCEKTYCVTVQYV